MDCFLAPTGLVLAKRRQAWYAIATAWLMAAIPFPAANPQSVEGVTNTIPMAGNLDIARRLATIRERHNLPAMSALVLTSTGICAQAVVGVRKRGTDIPVSLDDAWHLGSETKAMTATLLARLVEQGRLRWDSPMVELFPEYATEMAEPMKRVTLLHLLSHQAGLVANPKYTDYAGADVPAERRRLLRDTLAKPPTHPPGSNYLYSNLGYILAGAVAEKITGQSWELALSKLVFQPFQMTNAGFGGLGTPGLVDQPWPHRASGDPTSRNGPEVDNPPVLGPAGRVHAPLADWAKYIQDQLRGQRGASALLRPESYATLRRPPFGGDYALGWLVLNRAWAGGTTLHHTGDNTMNHANVWIAPRRDFAILVCANQGGDEAATACDEAVAALIRWCEEAVAGGR